MFSSFNFLHSIPMPFYKPFPPEMEHFFVTLCLKNISPRQEANTIRGNTAGFMALFITSTKQKYMYVFNLVTTKFV
jgi:hypothetical protein